VGEPPAKSGIPAIPTDGVDVRTIVGHDKGYECKQREIRKANAEPAGRRSGMVCWFSVKQRGAILRSHAEEGLMGSRQAYGAVLFLLTISVIPMGNHLAAQQKMDDFNLGRAREILRDAHEAVKSHYYDPKFHGLDWEARFLEFDEKIKSAPTLSQAFGVVAAFFDGLNDSHTSFRPPARPYSVDYGYRMKIFGDTAFIWQVRPGTDAESKVHTGTEWLATTTSP
jgi:hypothetical protein